MLLAHPRVLALIALIALTVLVLALLAVGHINVLHTVGASPDFVYGHH